MKSLLFQNVCTIVSRIRIAFTLFLFFGSSLCFADLQLLLPDAIYAAPGIEMNVYFDALVLVVNPDAYRFEVSCTKGRTDAERWRFIPTEKEAGVYDWQISVYNDSGKVAEGTTKLIVSGVSEGKEKNSSILMIGDSLTGGNTHSKHLQNLFRKNKKTDLRFVGTSFQYRSAKEGEAANEGYGGWSWNSFLTRIKDESSVRPWLAKSPFLFQKGEKEFIFDFAEYCRRNNGGRAPDVITFMLGINDVAWGTDSNYRAVVEKSLNQMEELIRNIRKDAPNSIIGISMIPRGAASQDAYGANYKNKLSRFRCNRNQHAYNAALLKKIISWNDPLISIIPIYLNLDSKRNFPMEEEAVCASSPEKIQRQINALHPNQNGQKQIGESFYCWLNAKLKK